MLGCLLIGTITVVCYRLQLNLSITGFIYLIVVVLQSLVGSFASSAAVSVVAVLCLDFFFTPPLFSFEVTTGHPGADFVLDDGAGHHSAHHTSTRGGRGFGSPTTAGGSAVPTGTSVTCLGSRKDRAHEINRIVSGRFWTSGGLLVRRG